MSAVCRNRKCGRPTDGFLCTDCVSALETCLDGVPWLLDQLAVTELRLDRVNAGLRTGKRPDRPMPFNTDAADLHAALGNSITSWVRHMCESRGIDYVPVGYLPAAFVGPIRPGERRVPADFVDTAAGAARWLQVHVESVRLDESAGVIFRDITRLAETALAAINPPPVPGFRGPCPTLVRISEHVKPIECGELLYIDDAASTVYSSNTSGDDVDAATFITCPRCNIRHDVAKLEQQLLARIGNQLFELPDLLRVLRELGQPIPRGTVASWISRGQLQPQRHDGGRPLYRLDDVRRLRTLTAHPKGSTA
ncbi:MerR family transcriptional regulator [Nocardia tengchongensis]|uniref:hypothetical protein n=1 Tax=Nocardia tengchongensis TaxID=2055889 RepID=UPI00365F6DE3